MLSLPSSCGSGPDQILAGWARHVLLVRAQAGNEPAYTLTFPFLDVGKTPTGGASTEFHWFRKLAIAAPAPDGVPGHTEASRDLVDREVEVIGRGVLGIVPESTSIER